MIERKDAKSAAPLDQTYHADHIMPVKLGGETSLENMQLLCPRCNLSKESKHPAQWIAERLGAC